MKVLFVCFLAGFFLVNPMHVSARGVELIELPKPDTKGGQPLMQALNKRESAREFDSRELPLQVLSDLLWAAGGVNRPETDGRTAPTAHGRKEIDVYVAKADGLFLYEPQEHMLIQVSNEDIRAVTGVQPFVAVAPVNLIFVADHRMMTGMTAEEKEFYSATDTGFMSQNVYLYCASAGLATVVRGSFNRLTLKKAMHLLNSQTIVLTQTVGYPG
jgi:SagB-type dehydrogenase family enzyme